MTAKELKEILNKLEMDDAKVLINEKSIDTIKIYIGQNTITINSFGGK